MMGLLESLGIEVDIERLVFILLIILKEGSLCIHDVYLQRVRFQAEQVIILQEPDSSPAEVAIQIMSLLPEFLNIDLVLSFIIDFISIVASNSAKKVRPYFRNSLKHFIIINALIYNCKCFYLIFRTPVENYQAKIKSRYYNLLRTN